jgi:hypothetical protein
MPKTFTKKKNVILISYTEEWKVLSYYLCCLAFVYSWVFICLEVCRLLFMGKSSLPHRWKLSHIYWISRHKRCCLIEHENTVLKLYVQRLFLRHKQCSVSWDSSKVTQYGSYENCYLFLLLPRSSNISFSYLFMLWGIFRYLVFFHSWTLSNWFCIIYFSSKSFHVYCDVYAHCRQRVSKHILPT